MERWSSELAAGLCLTLTLVGCSSMPAGNPFANSAKPSSAQTTPLASSKATGSKAATGVVDKRKTAGGGAQVADRQLHDGVKHDPSVVELVKSELADAPEDERNTLLMAFKDLPDDSIRQVLSTRRKGMRYTAQQAGGNRNTDQIAQASHQSPGTTGAPGTTFDATRPGHSPNGLGSVNAWGGQGAPGPNSGRAGSAPAATAIPAADPAQPPVISTPGAVQPALGETPAPFGHSSGYRSPNPATGAVVQAADARPAKPAGLLGNLAPGNYGPPATGAVKVGAPASVSPGTSRELAAPAGGAIVQTSATAQTPSNEYLARLIAATENEVARLTPGETDGEKRTFIEKHVYLRMLYLMAGQQERALQAIPGVEPADQEFWQQTFWGLANYFDANSIPSTADRAAQTVAQLTNAVLRLQSKANLDLRNVNFCHKISSFGNYEKYVRDEFSPGQEVLLYAEVANIHSEPVADGKYRTSLKSTLEIYRYGTQGELVEKIDLPETVDLCRTHRRDYFHSYQFTIPAKLTLGPHVLKLLVEDQVSRRVASYSLNFTVK